MDEKIKFSRPVPPFVRYCAATIPTMFDDSLSYYEALCALNRFIQKNVVEVVNNNAAFSEKLKVQFDELKEFVDHYFDNLDVQEEINNKLDAMAESGELQEIITTYIQSNVTWTFDTVSDMQAATNLIDGSYARTLGYYSVKDGGDALYKIEESSETEDGGSVINLTGGLQAKLIPINGIVNVKQFGAKGDNSTYDTMAISNALAFNNKVEFAPATYKVTYLIFPANATIYGNNAIINSLREDGVSGLNSFGSNSTINDLTINSLNNDREWNRIDLRDKHDITFNNCKFSGFRHVSDNPNAWALFMRSTQKVVLNKCYFENNTFQDVLIEVDCKDIVFNDCDGDHFYVDIEPGQNSTDVIENVTFNRCNMYKVHIYENFLTTTQILNLSFNDCKISTVVYDGGTTSFNNCIISVWEPSTSDNRSFAGSLECKQSLNLGKDLIQDNYFDSVCLSNARSWWYVSYSNGINYRTGLTSVREDGTNYIVLNPSNAAGTIWVSTPHITASAGDKFLLRYSGKANYPNNAGWISEMGTIRFYNSSDEKLASITLSAFRAEAGSTTPKITQNALIQCPANTAYFVVHFRNGRGGEASVSKLYLETCQLFKLNERSQFTSEIPELPIRKYRTFHSNAIPSDNNNYMPYHVGDTMLYNDPATAGYIGATCVAEAEEGHYVGTWKKFGALES